MSKDTKNISIESDKKNKYKGITIYAYVASLLAVLIVASIYIINGIERYEWTDEGFELNSLSSNGFFAENGNIVVERELDKLVVTDKSNKEEPLIIDDFAFYLNVTEEGLFYENVSDGNMLYKTSFNGKDSKTVVDDEVTNVLVYNDWIYFSSYTEGNKIFRVDIEGKNRELLVEEPSINFFIDNDKIYYADLTGGIYRVNLDGSNKNKLVEGESWRLSKSDDSLYYIDSSVATGSLIELNLTSNEKRILVDDKVETYIVNGDKVYYSTDFEADNIGLFEVDISSGEVSKLSDYNGYGFYIKNGVLIMERYYDAMKTKYDLTTKEFITEQPE